MTSTKFTNYVSSIALTLLSLCWSVFANSAGDPEAGKLQAMVCAGCHGLDGATPVLPEYPNLAGQNEKYLYNQLAMFQSGTRDVPLMTAQLIGKSEQDLEDLAAFYASLPAKGGEATGTDEDLRRAQQIYKGGIMDKKVAACAACHGPGGVGNAQAGFPRINGQSVSYTIEQLTKYREGHRKSDESFGGMMRGVAHGLTDGEIAILADYVRGLRP